MNEEQTKHVIDTLNANTVIVQEMNHQVKRLNTAVLGDEEAGIKGIADRMGKAEGDISCLNTKMSWAKGMAWAVSAVVAVFAFVKDHIRIS